MWKHLSLLLCLFVWLALSSCGPKVTPKPQQQQHAEPLKELEEKYSKYLDILGTRQDQSGFIEADTCDSLLFSSLLGVVVKSVNIEAAKDSSNAWHRRPLTYEECYPLSSGSSISKDMMLGLFVYIWRNQRLDLAEQIFDYGVARQWKMGDGDPTRTILSSALRATLAEIIYRLGGENHSFYRNNLVIFSGSNKGYQAHLTVLHIFLRGELLKGISSHDLDLVKTYSKNSPRNAFFAYVFHKYTDGDQTQAITSLLDASLFPEDRLPTSADRKEPWLWQREDDSDWLPSNDNKEHSGADFLFVAHLILGSI